MSFSLDFVSKHPKLVDSCILHRPTADTTTSLKRLMLRDSPTLLLSSAPPLKVRKLERKFGRRFRPISDPGIPSIGETGHAFGHMDFLKDAGDPATGKPFGSTVDNLKSAIAGESTHYSLILRL